MFEGDEGIEQCIQVDVCAESDVDPASTLFNINPTSTHTTHFIMVRVCACAGYRVCTYCVHVYMYLLGGSWG